MTRSLVLALGLTACALPDDVYDFDGDGVGYRVDCNDDDEEVGERCEARCEGGWGVIVDRAPHADLRVPPEEEVPVSHVDLAFEPPSDRNPDDDGTMRQPFASLELALEQAERAGGNVVIALGPGTYETNLRLFWQSDTAATGPTIVGCSPDEVTLLAEQDDRPLLEVRAKDLNATDGIPATYKVTLAGVTVEGGRRAVRADGPVQLELDRVRVANAEFYAVQGYGRQVSLQLSEVEVDGVRPYAPPASKLPPLGVGVGALGGSALQTDGVQINGAVGAGVLIDGSPAEGVEHQLRRLSVTEVAPTEGRWGRGIQLSDPMAVTLEEVSVDGVHDAGVFARNIARLSLSRLRIDGVEPASSPCVDPDLCPADGIVFVQDLYRLLDPGVFVYTLENLDPGPARAPVVASGPLTVDVLAGVSQVFLADLAETNAPSADGASLTLDLEPFPDDPPN